MNLAKVKPTKEVKCSCGKNTVVEIKPATTYCKLTRFQCDCQQVYHIIDHYNGCICYYAASKQVDEDYLKQKSQELSTDQEIEDILTNKESGDNGDWPEFEVMKDAVTDFMADLPIETYEFLYKATQQEQDRLLEYLMAFE